MSSTDVLRHRAARLDESSMHRILLSIEMNTPLTYPQALEHWYSTLDKLGLGASVEHVLLSMGNNLIPDVTEDLRTLERAQQARNELTQRTARAFHLDDAGAGPNDRPRIDAKTYADVMGAQPVNFARLFEARQLAGDEYAGPDGERRFAQLDREMAESGVDLLADMRRSGRVRQAAQATAAASRRLDQALRKGESPAERRRLLDAAVADERDTLRTLEAATAQSVPAAQPTSELPKLLAGESEAAYRKRLERLYLDGGR